MEESTGAWGRPGQEITAEQPWYCTLRAQREGGGGRGTYWEWTGCLMAFAVHGCCILVFLVWTATSLVQAVSLTLSLWFQIEGTVQESNTLFFFSMSWGKMRRLIWPSCQCDKDGARDAFSLALLETGDKRSPALLKVQDNVTTNT